MYEHVVSMSIVVCFSCDRISDYLSQVREGSQDCTRIARRLVYGRPGIE